MLSSTVCTVVSVAGLGIAALTAYRKRFLAATRIAAISLLPVGLAMTGVIDWLTGVVFKPVVWAGFGVLALSIVLFMIARAAERHSLKAGGSRKERRAAARQRGPEAVAPTASAPSLGAGARAAQPAAPPKGRSKGAAPQEDFSDIEAILKKHGI
ncbi:hypothetical protein A6A06_29225 [Streptomyces sp. CB02923]|uniref:hypothetical protein n=1 Tax=Streptomyces sp. CB02923 TaxID=1718985 RepID=UPI00093D2AEE|nr:hypothetical protein [Streptomyces sp. CB02923]OKH98279.1 hypothetical protein A6A06_29225 [Streptomyces sp. CB02923]